MFWFAVIVFMIIIIANSGESLSDEERIKRNRAEREAALAKDDSYPTYLIIATALLLPAGWLIKFVLGVN